ncbi:MAG: hypothetical protein CMO81_09550 [Waddliaceae bacterium]|nr:hypothetical protein [Waddliaceae bacterium]
MKTIEDVREMDIGKELEQLWGSQEHSRIRACLFNLIIYSREPRRTAYFHSLVQMIIENFPCRIIFIEGTGNDDDFIRTDVSVKGSGKGGEIACDQIRIQASGESMAKVPFLLLPHIVPDLPVYLLWGQDPTQDNHILPHLEGFANKVIFDSETTDNLQRFSKEMLHQMQTWESTITDLNWARVSAWRNLFAQTFEDPEDIDHLQSSQKIAIKYNATKDDTCRNCQVQAIYLQGWLAGRLRWMFKELERNGKEVKITYITHSGSVEITLEPSFREDLPAGSIIGINVFGSHQSHYAMERIESTRQVKISISSYDQCQIPHYTLLSNLERNHSLMKEIFYDTNSHHYSNMLQAISQMDWRT